MSIYLSLKGSEKAKNHPDRGRL